MLLTGVPVPLCKYLCALTEIEVFQEGSPNAASTSHSFQQQEQGHSITVQKTTQSSSCKESCEEVLCFFSSGRWCVCPDLSLHHLRLSCCSEANYHLSSSTACAHICLVWGNINMAFRIKALPVYSGMEKQWTQGKEWGRKSPFFTTFIVPWIVF